MRAARLITVLIITAAALSGVHAAAAQTTAGPTTITHWDFDSTAQGWFAGHSVAPLSVERRHLVLDCTGGDPWIEESPGEISFDGSESQYIYMRAKVAKGGSAEFFWEVDEEGFAAGQETRLDMTPGEFRTYTVFPLWKGRITRLRFDPPDVEGERVLIDWIAINSLPPSQAPKEPVWDFGKGLQGWIPQTNVSDFGLEMGATRIAGTPGQTPVLLSPRFSIPAEEARFLSLRLRKVNVRRIIVYFATEDKPEFDARRFIIIPFYSRFIVWPDRPAEPARCAIDTTSVAGWTGRITRLRLDVEPLGGAPSVWLESASLGITPAGPGAVTVSFSRAPTLVCEGDRVDCLVRIQNVGGERLDHVAVGFTGFDGASLRPLSLEPGEAQEIPERFIAGKAGSRALRCFADVRGAESIPSTEEPRFRDMPHDTAVIRISRRPEPQPSPPGRPKAFKVGENIWLADRDVAACIVHNPDAYGPIFLFHRSGTAWRRVGVLLRPAASLTLPVSGPRLLEAASVRKVKGAAEVTLSIGAGGGGQGGAESLTLRVGRDGLIDVNSSFTSSRDDKLFFFRGITLLAGEGSFDGDFREALFPGLEYMKTGEHSSSDLDASPPYDLRYAPHPHRITIPLMAVSSPQGDVVSLMWQMPPNVRNAGPAAAFRSPNFMDNDPGHRMELFLPAIPEWTGENRLIPDRRMPLRAGQKLTVKASIFIGSGGVLDAVKAWYARYGLPDLPPLPRSYRQQVAFCIESYEYRLRVPGKGWLPGLLPWARFTERSPEKALQYLLADQILGKYAPFPALRVKGLAACRGNVDVNLAVHAGGLGEAMSRLRSLAYDTLASQSKEGGWYFQPTEKTEILGTPGEKAIGFAANRVALLLNAGRMLQDPKLIAAGKRGLAFMDQFRIPRAAQVWEVPVHTPDVLASAYALDAYLAGYLATGNKEYLRKAVYWAETGLPFIYTWQADEQKLEAMKYGSIPVFGATFFTGPWFGRLVQWCGLDYAASLLRLAEYDHTYPWRHIAEGITRSGIIQQRREWKYYGLFPDSVGMIDGDVSWGAMLAPVRIMQNVLTLMGRHPVAQVQTVGMGGGAISLVSAGDVRVGSPGRSSLDLAVSYQPGYASYLGIAGVAPGAAVRADGRLLPAGELSRLAEGTRYYDSLALLVVKIRHGSRPVRLSFTNLKPGKPPTPRTAWDFEESTQGWGALHDLAPLRVRDGRLLATITGADPFMAAGGLRADASLYKEVRILMKSPESGLGQVFFAANGRSTSEAQSKRFYIAKTDDFLEYFVDMSDVPGWKGTITELRLDPVGPVGSTVEIEEISLVP